MLLQSTVVDAFRERYAAPPALVVRAPGRVNLIGEHTDYNDGFVLPMAIDRAVWVALRPRTDRLVAVHALDFAETAWCNLDDLRRESAGWAEYVQGVAWALQKDGYALTGWEGVVAGDVPQGAGLSSSAALELAVARAFAELSGLAWDAPHMARLCQRAENEWVGLNCGIMDQLVVAAAVAGHALFIDCRSLEHTPVPLPPQTAVVVLDTGTRRELVGSAYNERRRQCDVAARFFGQPALRDVTPSEFLARADQLDPLVRQRARHVISENERTLQAVHAMREGDAVVSGQLMNASHASLRDDYAVSSHALDAIVTSARNHPGCFGTRMTGAGFGGCAVALVRHDAVDDFTAHVAATYTTDTDLTPTIYVCAATTGAEVVARSEPLDSQG